MDTCVNTFGDVCIYWFVYTYTFPCCISGDGLEALIPKEKISMPRVKIFVSNTIFQLKKKKEKMIPSSLEK